MLPIMLSMHDLSIPYIAVTLTVIHPVKAQEDTITGGEGFLALFITPSPSFLIGFFGISHQTPLRAFYTPLTGVNAFYVLIKITSLHLFVYCI